MKIILTLILILTISQQAFSEEYCATTISEPPLDGSWEAISEFTDEFDGENLNSNKWNNYDPKWEGRYPSYFEKDNVYLANGKLHLGFRKLNSSDSRFASGNYTHAASATKSKNKIKYGYFEIKAKPMTAKVFNSFWFWDSNNSSPTPKDSNHTHTEIDVFEIVGGKGGGETGEGSYLIRTAHIFNSPTYKNGHIKFQDERKDQLGLTDYHIYGLDWTKDTLTWYVDGIKVFTVRNDHWHQALYMIFDTELNTAWPGIPNTNTIPNAFEIEYIRSWKRCNN